MSQTKLALYALSLELAAWLQLHLGGGNDLQLLRYFLAHGGASAVLASLVCLLRPQLRPRRGVWLLIFGFSFTVPVLGFLTVATGALLVPLLPRFRRPLQFSAVRLPELDTHERRESGAFRQAGVRQFLKNQQAPMQQRLRALVALNNAPTNIASPMLRDLLTDAADDLRLLAYGMLDTEEKKLNAAIHDERLRFEAAGDDTARAVCAQRLADLYWELIYQGLALGDLREHAAREALRYTDLALAHSPADAGLLLRRGRLLHELADLDGAAGAYEGARAAGLPETRVLPYLAEIAFERRDFPRVRALLAPLAEWQGLARLQQVVHLWVQP